MESFGQVLILPVVGRVFLKVAVDNCVHFNITMAEIKHQEARRHQQVL